MHARWGTCVPGPPTWTKSVDGPVTSVATAELEWCAPYVTCRWSVVQRYSGQTVVALIDSLQLRKAVNCNNPADTGWKPGQATERLSASVIGWSVLVTGAAGSNQRDRPLWRGQPSSADCPELHTDHEQLTVHGCWQTVAGHHRQVAYQAAGAYQARLAVFSQRSVAVGWLSSRHLHRQNTLRSEQWCLRPMKLVSLCTVDHRQRRNGLSLRGLLRRQKLQRRTVERTAAPERSIAARRTTTADTRSPYARRWVRSDRNDVANTELFQTVWIYTRASPVIFHGQRSTSLSGRGKGGVCSLVSGGR